MPKFKITLTASVKHTSVLRASNSLDACAIAITNLKVALSDVSLTEIALTDRSATIVPEALTQAERRAADASVSPDALALKYNKERLWSNEYPEPIMSQAAWRFEIGKGKLMLGYWDWVSEELNRLLAQARVAENPRKSDIYDNRPKKAA